MNRGIARLEETFGSTPRGNRSPPFALGPNTAASWPNRPIHLIVPYPPGGGTDLLARVIGAQLEKSLGQAIVIDNRPGGSTVIGTNVLANAAPDG